MDSERLKSILIKEIQHFIESEEDNDAEKTITELLAQVTASGIRDGNAQATKMVRAQVIQHFKSMILLMDNSCDISSNEKDAKESKASDMQKLAMTLYDKCTDGSADEASTQTCISQSVSEEQALKLQRIATKVIMHLINKTLKRYRGLDIMIFSCIGELIQNIEKSAKHLDECKKSIPGWTSQCFVHHSTAYFMFERHFLEGNMLTMAEKTYDTSLGVNKRCLVPHLVSKITILKKINQDINLILIEYVVPSSGCRYHTVCLFSRIVSETGDTITVAAKSIEDWTRHGETSTCPCNMKIMYCFIFSIGDNSALNNSISTASSMKPNSGRGCYVQLAGAAETKDTAVADQILMEVSHWPLRWENACVSLLFQFD